MWAKTVQICAAEVYKKPYYCNYFGQFSQNNSPGSISTCFAHQELMRPYAAHTSQPKQEPDWSSESTVRFTPKKPYLVELVIISQRTLTLQWVWLCDATLDVKCLKCSCTLSLCSPRRVVSSHSHETRHLQKIRLSAHTERFGLSRSLWGVCSQWLTRSWRLCCRVVSLLRHEQCSLLSDLDPTLQPPLRHNKE